MENIYLGIEARIVEATGSHSIPAVPSKLVFKFQHYKQSKIIQLSNSLPCVVPCDEPRVTENIIGFFQSWNYFLQFEYLFNQSAAL